MLKQDIFRLICQSLEIEIKPQYLSGGSTITKAGLKAILNKILSFYKNCNIVSKHSTD